jgi:hypothetical protein
VADPLDQKAWSSPRTVVVEDMQVQFAQMKIDVHRDLARIVGLGRGSEIAA